MPLVFDATKYEFAEQCPSRMSSDITPYQVISRPSPSTVAMFENTNRNALLFLRAAGIESGSEKHKKFKATIQALHRQYLHPFKYIEEQAPDHVDQLIAKVYMHIKDQLHTDYKFRPGPDQPSMAAQV